VLLFVLLLLLLAAATGVLGAVLKATLVVVMSLVLSVVALGWLGTWYAKRRMRELQQEFDRRIDHERRRQRAYDVGEDQAGRPRIGDGS
jgi:membrane protein implicated in regulation of membrane protease activity